MATLPQPFAALTSALTVRYMAALAAIACLSLSAQVLIQLLLDRQGQDSHQVNLAGRQRMLSQRLTKTALIVEREEDPLRRKAQSAELAKLLGNWERVHAGLLKGDPGLDLVACDSAESRRLLLATDPHFQAMRRSIERVLVDAAEPRTPVATAPSPVTELLEEEPRFLEGMEEVVHQLDRESLARVSNLQRWEFTLLIATLVVLVAEALWVFRPTVQQIDQAGLQLEASKRELAEALEQSEVANRAKSRFLAQLSHEMRTPLSSCLGLNDLLLQRENHPERRMWLELMRDSARGLLHWMDDILDLARIEAGRLTLHPTPFDPEAVFLQRVRTFLLAAEAKGLKLDVECDLPPPLRLEGDPDRLRQIVTNLVSNALKFTPAGSIHVRLAFSAFPEEAGSAAADPGLSKSRGELTLEVRDTGVGIPADRLEAIFEPFVQASSEIQQQFGGSGLGLAIVREIVALHGGRTNVESTPGLGSRFVVHLPYAIAPETPSELPPAAGPTEADDSAADAPPPSTDEEPFRPLLALVCGDTEERRRLERYLAPHYRVAAWDGGAEDFIDAAAAAGFEPGEVAGVVWRQPAEMEAAQFQHRLVARLGWPTLIVAPPRPMESAAGIAALPRVGWSFLPCGPWELHRQIQALLSGRGASLTDAGREFVAHDGAVGEPSLVDVSANARFALPPVTPLPGPLRVLVVEDSAPNQLVLCHFLREYGVEPITADDGEEALEALAAEPIDLVLLDLHLPDMDGLEVVRRRRAAGGRFPMCVAITAHANPEVRRGCLDAGLFDCIPKPIDRFKLGRFLHVALNRNAELAEDGPDAPAPPSTVGGGSGRNTLLEVEGEARGHGEEGSASGAEAAHAAGTPTCPYPPRALARLGGDVQLWRQMAKMFLNEAPAALAEMEAAWPDRPDRVRLLAHRFAGQISFLADDEPLLELLRDLEDEGARGTEGRVAEHLPAAAESIRRFCEATERLHCLGADQPAR